MRGMAYKNPKDQKRAARKHYLENKALYVKRAKVGKKKSIARNREFLLQYLLRHPCIDCREDNPIVLEFDHKKELIKLGNLSNMMMNGVSINKLQLELEKCDVRCANCHRIKTAKEEDWWIYRAAKEPGSSPVS